MNYKMRYIAFFILDSLIVISAIFFSFWLFQPSLELKMESTIYISAFTLLLSHHIVAYFFKMYSRIWSVASVRELLAIFYSVTASVLVACLLQYLIKHDVYERIMTVTWMLHIIFIGGSRFIIRLFNDEESFKNTDNLKRILIVGAGKAGTMLTKNLQQDKQQKLNPVAFIDDDPNKLNLTIMNVKVAGKIKDIHKVVKNFGIEEIIIALPSLSKSEMKDIHHLCLSTNLKVRVMPRIEDVMTGTISVKEMKEISFEDLLGRDEVTLDMISISSKITDQVILVTGAGGSIGSEICRQLCRFGPKKLLLLGHGENSIYNIYMELLSIKDLKVDCIPIIADVKDAEKIAKVMQKYRPHVVYHAAAHKHVPLMELNFREAVDNNVLGTRNVAYQAHVYGIKHFVLVSTDKAVNPPNIMGATKRLAEMCIQNLAKQSTTKFVAVRFGNVLGSRGSVVPLFKKQIEEGGPVKVTHPEVTRYFMTIPEASRLVIQAGALGNSGDIFALDMGEPVKIVDLAKNLIQLSGYKNDEIAIEFIGLRPGEKMHEEIYSATESGEKVFDKITLVKNSFIVEDFESSLRDLLGIYDDESFKEELINIANNKVLVE
ncbi:nucleoside-diphosphate sugar epimerase/dehydratase [Solibacillus sp. CAU 1738]|uniref:polysaccharide biosynthesis protein n=1 Tax=Solibacillus sp. CAU 1738 TaxID=3140363 RepID=UPI0032609EEA